MNFSCQGLELQLELQGYLQVSDAEAVLMVNPLTLALLPLGLGMALGHRGAERLARGCVGMRVLGSLLAGAFEVLPASGGDHRVSLPLLRVANLGFGVAHGLCRRRAAAAPAPAPARLQRV